MQKDIQKEKFQETAWKIICSLMQLLFYHFLEKFFFPFQFTCSVAYKILMLVVEETQMVMHIQQEKNICFITSYRNPEAEFRSSSWILERSVLCSTSTVGQLEVYTFSPNIQGKSKNKL